jgi:hypothetical protein
VGKGLVCRNTVVRQPSATLSEATGVFVSAVRPSGTVSVRTNGILKDGSSQTGNA